MDCERMDPARKLRGERCVDHPVALDPALPLKGLRHNINPEMRLSARPVARVPFMLVRFIDNPQGRGGESPGQLFHDDVCDDFDPTSMAVN